LFRRRAWPAWVGLGFGAGRAWEECDNVRDEFGTSFHAVMLTKFLVIQARSGTDEGWFEGAPPTVEEYREAGVTVPTLLENYSVMIVRADSTEFRLWTDWRGMIG